MASGLNKQTNTAWRLESDGASVFCFELLDDAAVSGLPPAICLSYLLPAACHNAWLRVFPKSRKSLFSKTHCVTFA